MKVGAVIPVARGRRAAVLAQDVLQSALRPLGPLLEEVHTAVTATAAGETFLNYQQPAKDEEFYTIALSKPGVDTQRVLTRLGIAQLDQGKVAEAKATFAKVTGPRQQIAQLWTIYAGQKGG